MIIHGTEHIDDRVKKYIKDQFDHMYERGGRVVYSYNDVDTMLADSDFNKFDAADYTLFGPMRDGTVAEYQKQLHQRIPPDLAQLITTRGENLTYLRRGVSNVVFHLDLALGINPYREAQRRQVRLEAARAEEAARMDAIMHDKPAPAANLTSIRKHSEGGDGEADAGQSVGGKRREGTKSLQQPEDGARRPAGKSKPKKLVKA